MSAIRIVDTSVFCNIIGVPNRSQDKKEVIDDLKTFRSKGDTFLLPMAAVYETGNHVAQVSNGQLRRQTAKRFTKQVRMALDGMSPFSPTQIHDIEDVKGWLDGFPKDAMHGIGIGDRSIITVWEQQCDLNPSRRVIIWTYDSDLDGYDQQP